VNDTIGRDFQLATSYSRNRPFGRVLDWAHRPDRTKSYPDAPRIRLPEPSSLNDKCLDFCLRNRRSVRSYDSTAISQEDLSFLLWAADGISARTRGIEFRTAPSAGALYPIETYLVVNRVENLQPGVYHYATAEHALEQLRTGDFGLTTADAALGQEMCEEAAVVFVWSAVFARSVWKYDQRAYRYIYLDAGHIAQNLALAAVALGLGSCQIAALFDDECNVIVGVDGESESVIYMSTVGRPA